MNGQLKTKAKKTAFKQKTRALSTTQQHNDAESRSRHSTLHDGRNTRWCDETREERRARPTATQQPQQTPSRGKKKNAVAANPPAASMIDRYFMSLQPMPRHERIRPQDCLNFHFRSRRFETEDGQQRRQPNDRLQQQRRKHLNHKPQRHPPAFDREAFLQANFRFAVSDAVDIATFLSNPNQPFAWEDVLQVQMFTSENTMCPISLDSPPICPHITPCGHIFSFPSIMRHLMTAAAKGTPALCPLCYTKFDAQTLRWVHLVPQKAPVRGAEWRFSLMKKTKNGVTPVCASSMDTQKPAGTFSIVDDVKSHFLNVSSELAAAVLSIGEDSEMEVELEACFECSENLCQRAKDFEQRRLQQLDSQGIVQKTEVQIVGAAESIEKSIRQNFYKQLERKDTEEQTCHHTSDLPASSSHQQDWPPPSETPDMFDDDPWPEDEETEYLSFQFGSFSLFPFQGPSEQTVPEETPKDVEVGEYFYQSEDGQWLFLDPVNVQCLMTHYGSAKDFPHELSGSIVDVDEVTQAKKAVRNKLPYLSHLPKQASLRLVEIDLTEQLPRQCLTPVFVKRSQERKKTMREKALALQQQKEKKGEDSKKRSPLDMKNMPRLTGSASADTTFQSATLAQASRTSDPFSFASVTKNGYAPRSVPITHTTNPGEGSRKGPQQQKGPRSKKKKSGGRKKQRVLMSTAVTRK